MLTISKKNGAKSTAGEQARKGSKGRLELFAMRLADGFGLYFGDYGNYGKSRWSADFGSLTADQLREIAQGLNDLADGRIDTTHVPFTEVEASASAPAEAESAETPAETAPESVEQPRA